MAHAPLIYNCYRCGAAAEAKRLHRDKSILLPKKDIDKKGIMF